MARDGSKSGGRPKGSKNKTTLKRMEAIAKGGELPLDYMLRMMRDQTQDYTLRADMAKAAAPYVHPRLTSTEMHGDADAPPIKHSLEVCFVPSKSQD